MRLVESFYRLIAWPFSTASKITEDISHHSVVSPDSNAVYTMRDVEQAVVDLEY